MKLFLIVLATAVISVTVTLLAKRHGQNPPLNGSTAVTPNPPVNPKFSPRRLALADESAKLDADFRAAIQADAKTPAEATASLKVYEKYCNAEANLFSRLKSLNMEEHGSNDDPVLLEQEEATTSWV